MNLMGLFRSPQNELEKGGKPVPEEDAGIRTTCPHCGVQLPLNDLQDNLQVCTACGYHFRMGPRDRIVYLVDEESFQELYLQADQALYEAKRTGKGQYRLRKKEDSENGQREAL